MKLEKINYKLKKKILIYLVIILIFIICLLGYNFFIKDEIKYIKKNKEILNTKNNELEVKNTNLFNIDENKEKLKSSNNNDNIVSSMEFPLQIIELEYILNENSLNVINLKILNKEEINVNDTLVVNPFIEIVCMGSYSNIINFIDSLLTSKYYYELEYLNLKPTVNEGVLMCEIIVSSYYFKEIQNNQESLTKPQENNSSYEDKFYFEDKNDLYG